MIFGQTSADFRSLAVLIRTSLAIHLHSTIFLLLRQVWGRFEEYTRPHCKVDDYQGWKCSPSRSLVSTHQRQYVFIPFLQAEAITFAVRMTLTSVRVCPSTGNSCRYALLSGLKSTQQSVGPCAPPARRPRSRRPEIPVK